MGPRAPALGPGALDGCFLLVLCCIWCHFDRNLDRIGTIITSERLIPPLQYVEESSVLLEELVTALQGRESVDQKTVGRQTVDGLI